MVMSKIFEDQPRRTIQSNEGGKLEVESKEINSKKEEEFLRHTIPENGIKTTGTKVNTIRDWTIPRDKHQVRSFLRLCTYYRRFADIAASLHRLTDLNFQFNWTAECEEGYKRLKNALCSSPLRPPQSSKMFILTRITSE